MTQHSNSDDGVSAARCRGHLTLFEEALLQQQDQLWDRLRQLQAKNRVLTERSILLCGILLAYAIAPFKFENFQRVYLSSLWGFGGLWLSVLSSFYWDRALRAYGWSLLERRLCHCQMAYNRDIAMGGLPNYAFGSLLSVGISRRDHTRVSFAQLISTAYFYKFATAFEPFYCTLFLMLCVLPDITRSSDFPGVVSAYSRFSLGASAIWFAWLILAVRRCKGLLKNGMEASRIDSANPWPRFPPEDMLRREIWGGMLLVLRRVTHVWIVVLSSVNAARFVFLLLQPGGILVGYKWSQLDLYLATITIATLAFTYLVLEADTRMILGAAARVPEERWRRNDTSRAESMNGLRQRQGRWLF